jgi:RNA polymerase sporulation-specific sigma factor
MKSTDAKATAYDLNPELIARYRAGDVEAGDRLVELNLPLVFSVATRFRERCDDMSDLVECGTIGLVKAIKTFDLDRGCAFSTYAVPLIFGEVRRFLRDDGIIKVSREEKRLAVLINRERDRRRNLGMRCDVISLAEALGMSPSDVASAMFSEVKPRSLDESVFDDDDATTLGSMISDESEVTSFDKLALRMAIETLDEDKRKIVYLRYFKDYSQAETARILGLSQVKISREEKKIMRILESRMT